jgi:hypothetical protein
LVYIQRQRVNFLQLQIVRHQVDPFLEVDFNNALVEDKNLDNATCGCFLQLYSGDRDLTPHFLSQTSIFCATSIATFKSNCRIVDLRKGIIEELAQCVGKGKMKEAWSMLDLNPSQADLGWSEATVCPAFGTFPPRTRVFGGS